MSTTSTSAARPTPQATASEGKDALASLRIDRSATSRRWLTGKRIGILVAIALVVGFFMLLEYRNNNPVEAASWLPEILQKRVEVRLTTIKVQQGRSADAVVVATGYLESRRQAMIGARAAGRIDKVQFEEGDRVDKDQLLAELDHRDMDASLAAAAATVARAKSALAEQAILIEQAGVDVERAKGLLNTKSLSDAEYDQVRFAYKSAIARKSSMEAELELAIAQKEQTERIRENMFIRAPFAGTVISKDAEVGESILPGGMGGGSGRGSVATIADLDHLEIEVDVQEDFISRISEGQEAEIAVDAVQDKRFNGVVRKVIPMGDRARATIKVQVEITDADQNLFPEMSGTVFFLPVGVDYMNMTDDPRFFCVTSAITSDENGNQSVWIVDEARRAQRLPIKAGADKEGKSEILEGVKGNERVVVNPEDLIEGVPVTVIE